MFTRKIFFLLLIFISFSVKAQLTRSDVRDYKAKRHEIVDLFAEASKTADKFVPKVKTDIVEAGQLMKKFDSDIDDFESLVMAIESDEGLKQELHDDTAGFELVKLSYTDQLNLMKLNLSSIFDNEQTGTSMKTLGAQYCSIQSKINKTNEILVTALARVEKFPSRQSIKRLEKMIKIRTQIADAQAKDAENISYEEINNIKDGISMVNRYFSDQVEYYSALLGYWDNMHISTDKESQDAASNKFAAAKAKFTAARMAYNTK